MGSRSSDNPQHQPASNVSIHLNYGTETAGEVYNDQARVKSKKVGTSTRLKVNTDSNTEHDESDHEMEMGESTSRNEEEEERRNLSESVDRHSESSEPTPVARAVDSLSEKMSRSVELSGNEKGRNPTRRRLQYENETSSSGASNFSDDEIAKKRRKTLAIPVRPKKVRHQQYGSDHGNLTGTAHHPPYIQPEGRYLPQYMKPATMIRETGTIDEQPSCSHWRYANNSNNNNAFQGVDASDYPRKMQSVGVGILPPSQDKRFLKDLDLFRTADRLATFTRCRTLVNDNVFVDALVQSGFYFWNHPDVVRCIYCDVVVDGWDLSHDVTARHRRLSPECQALRGIGEMKSSTGVLQNKTTEPHMPAHEHMKDCKARKQTYHGHWPQKFLEKREDFSSAGFFYSGEDDKVTCWYCDGSLDKWRPDDDPWVRHAKHFPRCDFVISDCPDYAKKLPKREYTGPLGNGDSATGRIPAELQRASQ